MTYCSLPNGFIWIKRLTFSYTWSEACNGWSSRQLSAALGRIARTLKERMEKGRPQPPIYKGGLRQENGGTKFEVSVWPPTNQDATCGTKLTCVRNFWRTYIQSNPTRPVTTNSDQTYFDQLQPVSQEGTLFIQMVSTTRQLIPPARLDLECSRG